MLIALIVWKADSVVDENTANYQTRFYSVYYVLHNSVKKSMVLYPGPITTDNYQRLFSGVAMVLDLKCLEIGLGGV